MSVQRPTYEELAQRVATLDSQLSETRTALAEYEAGRELDGESLAALRESEERYRTLVENVKEGIWVLDDEFRVTFVNPRVEKLLGRRAEEIIGTSIFEFITRQCQEIVKRCLDGDQTLIDIGQDIAFRCEEGPHVFASVQYVRNEPDGWIVCMTDVTNYKVTARALHATEEDYRALVENVNIGVYRNTGGPNGQFLRANPAIAEMFGYDTVDEFMQVHVSELYQDPEERKNFVAEALREGYVRDKELRLKKKDGTPIWGSCTARVKSDRNGEIQWLDGVIEDISDRKAQDDELRDSREQEQGFREQLAALHEATVELAATDSLDDVCRRSVELGHEKLGLDRIGVWFLEGDRRTLRGTYGIGPDGQLRDEHESLNHVGPGTLAEELLKNDGPTALMGNGISDEQAPGGGLPRGERILASLWDGKQVIGLLAVDNLLTQRPFTENDRHSIGLYASALGHLCARQRAVEALRESERRYRTLFEGAAEGITAADVETRQFAFANPAICRLFGYTEQEFITLSVEDLHPADAMEYVSSEFEAQAAGRKRLASAIPCRKKDGTVFFADVNTAPAEINGRRCAVGFFHDISERKLAEEALRESEERHRILFESSRDAIMTLAPPNWGFTSGNPATLEMFRTGDEATFINTSPWRLSPEVQPDGRRSEEKARDVIDTAMLEGTNFFEWRHKRLDGEEFPASVLLTRVRVGDQVFLQATVRDITAQKAAEEALRESEQRYALAQRAAGIGSWEWNVQTKVGTWSDQVEHIMGFGHGEFDGSYAAWVRHVRDDHVQAIADEMAACIEGHREYRVTYPITLPDGEERWVEMIGDVIYDDHAEPVSVLGVCMDITERKRAEEEIRELNRDLERRVDERTAELARSEERYRAMHEAIPDSVHLYDAGTGKFIQGNDAYFALRGYTVDDLNAHLGQPFWDVHPDDREKVTRLCEEHADGDGPRYFPAHRRLRKDGTVYWAEVSTADFDLAGRQVRMSITRDVTQRVEAQDELTRSEERFRALFEAIPDAIFVYDRDNGALTDVNAAFCDLYGYADEGIMPRTAIREWVHEEDREKHHALARTLRERPGPRHYPPHRRVRADGSVFWAETSAANLATRDRRLAVIITKDITARLNAESALKESEARYRTLAESAQEYIYIIDPDLRVEYVNNYTADQLHQSPRDVIGRHINDLFSEPGVSRMRGNLQHVFETGQAMSAEDTIGFLGAPDRRIWLETALTPLFDESNAIRGVMGISRDVTERKRAEEALRHSRQQFELLVNNARDVIFRLELDRGYTFLSPSVVHLLGYTPEDFYADPAFYRKITHPDDLPRVEQMLVALTEGKVAPRTLELRQIHKDGHVVHEEYTFTVDHDASGKIVALEGVCRDITERKRTEQALRESEEKYRRLVESVSDGVYATDADGRFTYVNDVIIARSGRPREWFDEHIYLDIVQPEDRTMARENFERVMRGEIAPSFEVSYQGAGGKVLWVEIATSPVMDGERIIGVHGISRNITERKLAELALRDSEERYRGVFETAPLAFVMWDSDCHITAWNPYAEKVFGWPTDEALGKNFFELIIPEQARPEIEGIVSRLLAGELPSHSINDNLTRGGKVITCEWSNAILRDDAGQIVGALSLGLDITDRRRTEEELAGSELRYRSLFEHSLEGIGVSQGNQVLDANPALLEMFGYDDIEQFTSKSIMEHIAPESREMMIERLAMADRGDTRPSRYDLRILRRDGEERDVEISSNEVAIGDEGVIQTTFRDITDRKQATEALQASEARYRSIYDAIPDAVSVYDPETRRIASVNDTMIEQYGFSESELIGRHIQVLIPGQERDDFKRLVTGNLKQGGPTRSPIHHHRRKDGSFLWVDITSVPIEIDGRPLRLAILRDVTESVEARGRIERQAEILKNVSDAVAVFDAGRDVIYWSPSAEAMFGYTQHEIAETHGLGIVIRDSDQVEAYDAEVTRKLAEDGAYSHSQLPCRRKDGEEIWVDIRVTPLTFEPGGPEAALFVARDVTQQVQMRQRLITAERMATIGTLGLSLSHELNNMLGGLRGLSDLAASNPDLIPRLLDTCRAVAERGGAISMRMTSLAKADAVGEERRVNLASVVQTVMSMMTPSLSPRDINVVEEYDTVPFTWVNEGKILQVLLNLVANARDSIGRNGQINVTVRHDTEANEVVVSMRDTGAGIRPEDMARLFDPFFTTKSEAGPDGAGEPSHLGLGLPESRTIAQHYGGDILVESELGQGATFTVRLPLRSAPTASIHDRLAPAPMPEKGTRMLVADDDELMRFWLSEHLANRGYEVSVAENGRQALDLCREHEFEYVFLDMLMPGEIDGTATCRELHALQPDARIIISTAFVREHIPDECLQIAFSLLKKPFGPDEIAWAFAGDKKT
jgi:PAS domain S-box-containing protein